MGREQQQASSGLSVSRRGISRGGNSARGWNSRIRASMFRRTIENQRVINLIDECGHQSRAIQEGRMNATSHESVLAALENWANRYSNRGSTRKADNNLVSWALDETGTINASLLCNNGENNE